MRNGFSITPGGKEKVLHSFAGGSDGQNPQAELINVNGTLYGTTKYGGASGSGGWGTVFSITPGGKETVVYSFAGGSDGAYPHAGLLNAKGTLYGTTSLQGGSCGCGTVFSITPGGTETVLHSFAGGRDGAYPAAGLLNVKGTLYGTTNVGGKDCTFYGCGTVFSITPGGTETVLQRFGPRRESGANPAAGLINVKGTLYGTTYDGGGHGCRDVTNACGTVFSITPGGTETVLHTFAGGSDGQNPQAGLINVKGTLYGTTKYGGAKNVGTIFSITPGGKETVLYSFAGGNWSDGYFPHGGLINVKGTLYGTTARGGAHDQGTVFSLTGL